MGTSLPFLVKKPASFGANGHGSGLWNGHTGQREVARVTTKIPVW